MAPNRHQQRNTRRREINNALSVLPTFTPLVSSIVYHIHRSTNVAVLHHLDACAQSTRRYTIDTETDFYTSLPALIQIEFIGEKSIVLLIETCHLPNESSYKFSLIKSLLKSILSPKNVIFSWGNIRDELNEFCSTNLFTSNTLSRLDNIDVQQLFQEWCYQMFSEKDLDLFVQNDVIRTYIDRLNENSNHKWSLQMAIAFAFDEFLDKSQTLNRWSQPLDPLLNKLRCTLRNGQMIRYAINDCLAVSKLIMLVEYQWTKQQLVTYNRTVRT